MNQYCLLPWINAEIMPDGSVYPCCWWTNSIKSMGNINEKSFEEVWNGKEFESLRKEMQNFGYSKYCSEICIRYNWGKSCEKYFNREESLRKKKIEILNITPDYKCNFRCNMCLSYSYDRSQCLSFKKIERLEETIKNLRTVHFGGGVKGGGEPFFSEKVWMIIDMVQNKYPNVYLAAVTNASLLNKCTLDKLFEKQWTHMTFSIDAATKETYEKIRKNGNWEQTINNIKLCREKFPQITLEGAYAIQQCNNDYNELKSFFLLCRKLRLSPAFYYAVHNNKNIEVANKVREDELLNKILNDIGRHDKN